MRILLILLLLLANLMLFGANHQMFGPLPSAGLRNPAPLGRQINPSAMQARPMAPGEYVDHPVVGAPDPTIKVKQSALSAAASASTGASAAVGTSGAIAASSAAAGTLGTVAASSAAAGGSGTVAASSATVGGSGAAVAASSASGAATASAKPAVSAPAAAVTAPASTVGHKHHKTKPKPTKPKHN